MDNQIYYLDKAPILQNKVYQSKEDAINAPYGILNIVSSKKSSLVYNKGFDKKLITYDQDYDNSVSSKLFLEYYDSIIEYLIKKYDLFSGTIIDIGCGKGTFLIRMAEKYPNIKAIGIDPSYEGDTVLNNGQLTFIKEYFKEDHLKNVDYIPIVLCRHTLEHIPNPENFLKFILSVFKAKSTLINIPMFIEVPDLDWIIEQNSFWDFCYEHTNYFTKQSLFETIRNSGGEVTSIKSSFGDQYMWGEFLINCNSFSILNTLEISNCEENPRNNFSQNLKTIIGKISNTLNSNKLKLVIWGMATKGVIYSLYLHNQNINISYCVDLNTSKQNKFTPISGLKITSPESLPKNEDYIVIIMNPNYQNEIITQCFELGLNAEFYTPNIERINI